MNVLDKINLIVEQNLSSYDKKVIIDAIKNPPTLKFKTTIGGVGVTVAPDSGGVKFVFDPEEYELEATLADIVDEMGGYKFKSRNKGNSFEFIVMLKTGRDLKK